MIVHAIANMIAHTIVKISMHKECMNEFYMECVRWMMDNGQTNGRWPDQPKTDDGQTIQKMMHQSRKICSLQNISF